MSKRLSVTNINNGTPPNKASTSEHTIESVLKYLADGGDYKDLSLEEMQIYTNYSKQKEEIAKQKHMERMKEIHDLQKTNPDLIFRLSEYEARAYRDWKQAQRAGNQGHMGQMRGGSAFSFTRLFASHKKSGSKRKSSSSRKSKRTQKRC